MVPRNTRTLIIKSAFPAGMSHAGIADTIAKSLMGKIDSIQVCPGGIISISFLDPHMKKTYEEASSICFDDVFFLPGGVFNPCYLCFSLFVPFRG